MQRRSFLKSAGALAAAAIPLTALNARAQDPVHKGGLRRGQTAGYGPLFPTLDATTGLPLIALPEGFRYKTFGWTGDALLLLLVTIASEYLSAQAPEIEGTFASMDD